MKHNLKSIQASTFEKIPFSFEKLGGLKARHKRPSSAILNNSFAALYTSGLAALAV